MSTSRDRAVKVWNELGTVSGVARKLGLTRATIQEHLRKAGINKPIAAGSKAGVQASKESLPSMGEVKRYILTSAQNNTKINEIVWGNLLALAKFYKAKIMVSRFTYNMNAYGRLSVKPGTEVHQEDLWYDPAIRPYISDSRIELAPTIVWCGEMNILPTASRPLTGLENYTGIKSAIFPHVKIAMESIATVNHDETKFNYTTGAVTKVNYIQKKAGLKAEFHHCYGGLLVEVESNGTWYARQLNADSTGCIYDMDVMVHQGKVTTGHSIEAINWGDIHAEFMDPDLLRIKWEDGGMVDVLKPKYQFFHDTVNFGRRNHHDRINPHLRFEQWVNDKESVEDEMRLTSEFLIYAARPFSQSIVVDSNHDNALERWLREVDYRFDPVNACFFLAAQSRKYAAIRDNEKDFHLVEWALQSTGTPNSVRFLRQDESFVICKDRSGGIECGMHGHLGPNGQKGSALVFSKMGRRANVGHLHIAGIIDGLYVAGLSSYFDLKYNRGPSSWSHSDILTYRNGKRGIVTLVGGGYRASRE